MSDKVAIKTLNGHPLADEDARKAASDNAKSIIQLSAEKADKAYMVALFEQLKELILAGNVSDAIAVLDQAILDQSILA